MWGFYRLRLLVLVCIVAALTATPAAAVTPERLFMPAETLAPAGLALRALAGAAREGIHPRILEAVLPCSSVGRVSGGRLLFGVPMQPSPGVHVMSADDAWTCPEVIAALVNAAAEVRRLHPGGPDLQVGDISRRLGGRYPPHGTHQSGRDVDLRYFVQGVQPGDHEHHFVSRYSIDAPRTWALIETLYRRGEAEVIYMDWSLQKVVYQYARDELGKTPEALAPIFSYPRAHRAPDALVQHVRNHHHHLHVRFHAPLAQVFGALWTLPEASRVQRQHDLLVRGKLDHVVRRGETLGHIARAHSVPLEELMRWNDLHASSVLRPGEVIQVLAID